MSAKEISELIDFLHDQNRQVRMIALRHLLSYSQTTHPQMPLFKKNEKRPIRDLLVLLRDIPRIACDAASILINLSSDCEIREILLQPEYILLFTQIITDVKSGLTDLICMILANLSKAEKIELILEITWENIPSMSSSNRVIDQLMDCYVKGHDKSLNPFATFDFLGNLFGDLTRFEKGREYFCRKQEYDGVFPISKIVVFTDHSRVIRRTGTASCIKNILFDINEHEILLDERDSDGMPEECQLLPPDKKRDQDDHIITLHLDSLLLLTSTVFGRDILRKRKVYPIIRELHSSSIDQSVKERVDRIVNLIMRDEAQETKDDQNTHVE
ncbi:Protein HGH1 [Neolecta irregularis DAH-3]|uniref:Protein HGH1 homolog n=1 Tax=Neolecta irregularis (strain DAH-3) TaxID=1198029 RepID=A0A1U7LTW0_NEOID|nr:Protein HGH1 [Neolecta irregularis DAH-3]|eukprot:OLL26115.1 Protein HGH1 [Neolecta irregularis DAH-3]